MCIAVPLQRLWQGLGDIWDAEPEESPPLLCQGQLDPSPALTDVLEPEQDQPLSWQPWAPAPAVAQ